MVKLNFHKDCTYEELLQIRGRIAKILHVNLAVLVLSGMDKGCVQLTFLIPKFVAEEVFPLSDEQTSALSKDVSVIRLECGQYIFELTQERTKKEPSFEVDPDFNIHTSYHNDFFLLRTRVLVNGESTEIKSVREGKYEGPVLNFCHSGSTISTKLSSILKAVSPILVKFGVCHVDAFYFEQSPLFHVAFFSESCLKNFVVAIGEVKSGLEPKLQSLFQKRVLETEPLQQLTVEVQQLTVQVQPDLFLVSPDPQETKGAKLRHLVTETDCSTFVIWKHSKLFDFTHLYQDGAEPPKITSQPMSQKDILPGKAVTFSVQATGTLPLSYQWQWKLFGRESADARWQNFTSEGCEGGTLQVREVHASKAGYYRCVVSNSGGSETSQYASLTVVPKLPELLSELQDVNDWITFGLYLGIRMSRLEAIKVDCPTLGERRTQMLQEWQNNVTPTWSDVVQALVGIGMRRLASELAQKHGISGQPDDVSLEYILQQEKATTSKLHAEVQKLKGHLEQEHKKLVNTEERLKKSQESKAKAKEKTREVMTELEKLHGSVAKLSNEMINLENKLGIKGQVLNLLCTLLENTYNQSLEHKIDRKRKKIERVEDKLQKNKSDLQSALQDVQTRQEELSQAQKELKKQHDEVIQLQRELACSYNAVKEEVSKLVHTNPKEIKQQLKDESMFKSQQIQICNADISRLSKKIETLSSSLQEKEAAAAQLQSELEKSQQEPSAQLLGFIKLRVEIAELEHRLQEAEEQKQQTELEKEAMVKELKTMEKLDEPPKVTNQPKSLSKVCLGTAVVFAIQATGTEPLSYHWQWKPAEEESGKWQPCPAEWCDGATLTIPSVQKSNEGSYRCIVSNCNSNSSSEAAELTIDEPPKITLHPKSLKEVFPTKPVLFTVQATGTDPLNYHWQWKPAGESEEWQPCDTDSSDGTTMTILSAQKSNEGSYRCVISNCAGTQTSNPAELSIADPPRVTTQPQDLKDAVPGNAVMFTVEATGTEPLSYHWQWKPAGEKGEWQPCDAEWSDGATLTIPSVQKSNEGSYRCVISNYAGTQTSNPAQLSVADPLSIATHPHDLKNAIQGKSAKFTIQATGTEPLSYHWQWKSAEEEGVWQACPAEWCDGTTLTIPSVHKSNEGSYRCVISNCAGTQTSNPAQLSVADPPSIATHPQDLKNAIQGKFAKFAIQATGTEPLSYHWQWKPPEEEGEWQPCPAEWSDGATLTIPSVQKSNEGSYRCVITNCAGTQTSNSANLSVDDLSQQKSAGECGGLPKITSHPQELKNIVPGESIMFTVEASGIEPLNYTWEWKPAESEEWQQLCDTQEFNNAILTIPSVQKSNEGSYRCVISNSAGSKTSKPAELTIVEPPTITTHPQEFSNVVQGKCARFSIQATGAEPLDYYWQWKPAGGSEEWQRCPAKWYDGATLTIPSVQKSNEGSYRCVVSNCVSMTSKPAQLSVVEPPTITTHPQEFSNIVQGKCARFSIQATGTELLDYYWQWQPAGGSEEWQRCPVEWCDGATLTIRSVQKSNEGSYRCVVSNWAGNQTSNSAKLETCLPLQSPLQLKWDKYEDIGYGMTYYPQTVLIQRNIYVGGGRADSDDQNCTIQVYDMDSNTWSTLPKYQYRSFSMTVINSNLTLVGGKNTSNRQSTNQLAVYKPSSQDWTYPYDPMPTPRHSPAVVNHDKWLLVAGGYGGTCRLTTVELLDTSTNQWLAANPLPTPCGNMSSATDLDYWYLTTARKQVFHVSLLDIVQQTGSKSTKAWSRLPDTPLEKSAAIIFHGSLLAVGGSRDNRTSSKEIYLYQPENERWTKAGELRTARQFCSCILLPSGKVLVIGGEENNVRTSRVDVATILD